jgi:hypothetical protein
MSFVSMRTVRHDLFAFVGAGEHPPRSTVLRIVGSDDRVQGGQILRRCGSPEAVEEPLARDQDPAGNGFFWELRQEGMDCDPTTGVCAL